MQSQFIHVTAKSLFRRRKSLRSQIGLCSLTVAILLIIPILYLTIYNIQNKVARETYGNWNFAVYDTSEKTARLLYDNLLVDRLGIMTIYGEIRSLNDDKSYYIGSVDSSTRSLISMSFEQGRYPETPTEIALEKELLLTLGIDDTLGSQITLTCTDESGSARPHTFILCGIVNSYHNNYLRQGRLVSGFVSTTYHNEFKTPMYTNTFVSLKEGYATETIVNELHDSASFHTNSTTEKWHYNTYIDTSWKLSYTPIFLIFIVAIIMLASIYHSFLNYYTHRFETLLGSQLLMLDKKKIMQLFRQESVILLPICIVIGGLEASLILFLFYKVARLFYPYIVLSVSTHYLLYSIGLAVLCIVFSMMVSRIHSYSLSTRQPVLHLPAVPTKLFTKHYNRFFYIMRRFMQVYKRSLLYYVILYMAAISAILLFATNTYYSYDCIKRLRMDTLTDYSIKKITDLSSMKTQIKHLKSLSEVDQISHFRYAMIDSYVLVDIPNGENDPQNNCCYLSIPDGSDPSSLTINDGKVIVSAPDQNYELTIQDYFNSSYPNTDYPFLTVPHIYVYCNTQMFNQILNSIGRTPYYYVRISYTEDCNPNVVTNIIDSILFGDFSFEICHNWLENEQACSILIVRSGILSIFCLLIFLTSFILLKNQQKAGLSYLQKELRIIWSLGFEKQSLRKYLLAINGFCMAIGTCISFLVVGLYYYWKILCKNWIYPFTLEYFYTTPGLIILSLFLLILYYSSYLCCIDKDIRRSLEKF